MKADNVDEKRPTTWRYKAKQQKAKQQKKLVEGYIAQMANEAQTEENNEKKKKTTFRFSPIGTYIYIYKYINIYISLIF